MSEHDAELIEQEMLSEPAKQLYVVEGYWTTMRQATTEIEASSPEEAYKLAIEDYDDWIGDNSECDDSDGTTQIAVWDENGIHHNPALLEVHSEDYLLGEDGAKALKLLKQIKREIEAFDGECAVEGKTDTGKVWELLSTWRNEIRTLKHQIAEKVREPGE